MESGDGVDINIRQQKRARGQMVTKASGWTHVNIIERAAKMKTKASMWTHGNKIERGGKWQQKRAMGINGKPVNIRSRFGSSNASYKLVKSGD